MILEIYPCKGTSDFPHKTKALRLFHVDLIMRAPRKSKQRTERSNSKTFESSRLIDG
jgi:hypothetical protein